MGNKRPSAPRTPPRSRQKTLFFLFPLSSYHTGMVIASAGSSQYTGVVYFSRLYVFPVEDAVFQNHIAVRTFSFGMLREPGLRQTFLCPNSVHAGTWVWPWSRMSPSASGGGFFPL